MNKKPANEECLVEVDDGFVSAEVQIKLPSEAHDEEIATRVYLTYMPEVFPTLVEASQHWEELSLPPFKFNGSDGFDIDEIPECYELDRTWYLTKIHMHWVFVQALAEHMGKTFDGHLINPDQLLSEAMALGALCREYELSQKHRENVESARLVRRQRSEGGKMRVHPQHLHIMERMRRRLADGQSVRQAARNTFEVDGLGTSAAANISLWKRGSIKNLDRS